VTACQAGGDEVIRVSRQADWRRTAYTQPYAYGCCTLMTVVAIHAEAWEHVL